MSRASDPQRAVISSQKQARDVEQTSRTAAEAGWHESRYNIAARIPGSKSVAIYNTYRRICAVYAPAELYLMNVLDEIPETHPIIERLSKRGVIANFDERGASGAKAD